LEIEEKRRLPMGDVFFAQQDGAAHQASVHSLNRDGAAVPADLSFARSPAIAAVAAMAGRHMGCISRYGKRD
jgi:hypothetical protein